MHDQSGVLANLSREDLQNQHFPLIDHTAQQWLEVQLNNAFLHELKSSVLVDMPGWESGIAAHSQAIDHYIHQSGAYFLVVSAEEGTLRQSMKDILTELKLFKKPVVLVVNKIDKPEAEDLKAIVEHLTTQVTQLLETKPLAVVQVSARKKKIQGMQDAIFKVIDLSDHIYHHLVASHFHALMKRMQSKISILQNEENLSIDDIQLQIDEIPDQVNTLKSHLTEVEAKVDGIIPQCVSAARIQLDQTLRGQSDALASAILRGSSVQTDIGNAVRQAVIATVENDLKPKMSQQLRSLENLHEFAPTPFSVDTQFSSTNTPLDTSTFSSVLQAVLVKLSATAPVLRFAIPFVEHIVQLFASEYSKQMQREQEREQARSHVISVVIPQVISQAESAFNQTFSDIANKVKTELRQECERKAKDKENNLTELQRQLKNEQDKDNQQKHEYQADFDQLNEMINALGGETK